MHRTDHKNPQNSIECSKSFYGYIVILLCVSLFYIINISFYSQFCSTIVPAGDPFTYTVSFYELLDLAHKDYWNTLPSIFTRNWLWLINSLIVLLSPILVKAPYSISLVNFIMFFFATASIFRLAIHLNFNVFKSLILSFLWWLYPSNYGFYMYQSTPVLGLDAMFLNALVVATLNTIIYSIDPEKIKNALISGISIGIAVWGRGNSAPIVLMVIFIPFVHTFRQLWIKEFWSNKKQLISVLLFLSIPVLMATWFYIQNFYPLKAYYAHHFHFYDRHIWNLQDSIHWIINVPGFYFWRSINTITIFLFSILSHVVCLVSVIVSFIYNKHVGENARISIQLISFSGFMIYFSTYIINIYLFSDPIFTEMNSILIYAPMLLGLTLCLFSIVGSFLYEKNIDINRTKLAVLIAFIAFYSIIMTKIQTPKPYDSFLPTPQEVEAFSINLERLLKGGKSLSMLWYGHYNPPILDYYRLENNLPKYKKYRYKYADDIWSPTDFSDKNRQHIKEEIINHLQYADYLIIPEYTDFYSSGPYAFYRFNNDFVEYINSPDAPRFIVKMILHDKYKSRLLLIQREEQSKGIGIPLKLPYGIRIPVENDIYSQLPTDRFIEVKNLPEIDTTLEEYIFINNSLFRIKASSNMDENNPGMNPALLISGNTIWHAQVPPNFPEWILIEHRNPVKKKMFIMKPQDIGPAGDEYLRAPKDFIIQASNDLVNWNNLLDVRNNLHKSGVDWHTWKFENDSYYLYYRIYITASGSSNLLTINRLYLN